MNLSPAAHTMVRGLRPVPRHIFTAAEILWLTERTAFFAGMPITDVPHWLAANNHTAAEALQKVKTLKVKLTDEEMEAMKGWA